MKTFNPFSRLVLDQRGVAMIEFVLVIPIFMILLVGTIEISNFIYANQKAQSAAENIINIVNLQYNISTPQLASMANMLPDIAKPLPVADGDFRVIITTMQREAFPANAADDISYILWQKAFGGAQGNSVFAYTDGGSKRDNAINSDALGGFTFAQGDQVMVVEVYMPYEPLIDNNLMDSMLGLKGAYLYHRTPPTRPRVGSFQFHPDDLV